MKTFRLIAVGALFSTFLLIGTTPAAAQCPEDNPDCPLEVPQSEQIDPNPENSSGSSENVGEPGAPQQLEAELPGNGPAIIAPLPIDSNGNGPPDFNTLDVPLLTQDLSDPTCGVSALGMAMGSVGDGSSTPTSDAIQGFLEGEGMLYDIGTGVEELGYAAHEFGFGGSTPFHGGDLNLLKGELDEGRAPVVALGSNGEGQPGHFVTVTGISPDGGWISYNDPILGEITTTTGEFSSLWALQGNSGVIVKKTIASGEVDPAPWVAFAAGLMALISQTPLLLRRTGIGGRLIAGGVGGSRRKKEQLVPRDPSPQMRNEPAKPKNKVDKLVLSPLMAGHVVAAGAERSSGPLGWLKSKWEVVVKPAVTGVTDFVSGAVMQFVDDMTFGAVETLWDLPWEENNTRAGQNGRIAGRVISTTVATLETIFGVGAILGGSTAIPPTAVAGGACAGVTGGACIPIAGGALAVEVGVIAVGALATTHGLGVLGRNLTEPFQFSKGGTGRTSSPNQMNHEIRTGRAPRGIERVDVPRAGSHEQVHVHFDDGSALNIDGTWKHGGTDLTSNQKKWLLDHGWKLPDG